MESSANLQLPFIMPSQAQKHVTHNEAIRALDALVQLSVADHALPAPPASPAEGVRYIVPSGATGAWEGHAGEIAAWQDAGWLFYEPRQGWHAWNSAVEALFIYDDNAWRAARDSEFVFEKLGINTEPAGVERFHIKADGALFDHQGGGHRLKVNKSAAAQTASLIFQTGYSGRAEVGTIGSDSFRVKISADGASWKDALAARIAGSQVYVGFGTDSPDRLLHLKANYGELLFEDPIQGPDVRRFNIFLYQGGTAFRGLNAAATGGTIWLYAKNDTGQVGLGTLTPTAGFQLDVVGAVRCTSLSQVSDAALKEVVGEAPGLDFIARLNPVLFRWNKASGGAGSRTHCGLVAQEVREAAEDLGFDFGGYKTTKVNEPEREEEHMLDYSQFIAPLIRAVQQLERRVAVLESRPPAVA